MGQGLLEEVADAAGALGVLVGGGSRALLVEAPVEVGQRRGLAVGVLPLLVDEARLDPLGQEGGLADAAPGDEAEDVGAVGPGAVEQGQLWLAAQEELGRVAQEARGGQALHGFAEGGEDVAQVADQLPEEVRLVLDALVAGIPERHPEALQVRRLAVVRLLGGVDEQRHTVVQGDEGFPLRVGQAGEVAEVGAQLGMLVEEVGHGFQVGVHGFRVGRGAGQVADQVDDGRAAADVAVELLKGVDGALLAEGLLDLDFAIGPVEAVAQPGTELRECRLLVLGFLRDAGEEHAVVGGHGGYSVPRAASASASSS